MDPKCDVSVVLPEPHCGQCTTSALAPRAANCTTLAEPDAALAQAKGMTEERVIERFMATQFQVYMIGFLPGFPYMGGLPSELAMPRLANPRPRVPAHSIAITGHMCAVYPWESPGGWNLIGRTPVQLFDLRNTDQPAMLAAGDTVKWYAIGLAEYESLLTQCQSGNLQREIFLQPRATS